MWCMHLKADKLNYYIIKQRDETIWRFSYENGAGVVCSILNRSQWSKNSTVCKNALDIFYVLLGDNDEIQVFCQDSKGSIILCSLRNGLWETDILIQRKSMNAGPVYFSVIQCQKDLHLFYTITDLRSNRQAVIHQVLYGGSKWSTPAIIDGIQPLSWVPFIICMDSMGNIYVFYQTIGIGHKLGYKKYLIDKEIWGNFNELNNSSLGYQDLSFLASDKCFNLLYIKKEEASLSLNFHCKDALWRKPVELFQHKKIEFCSLFKLEDDLWAVWVCDNKIYTCSSCDNGHSFSTPSVFRYIDSMNAIKAVYRSNLSSESNLCINEIYVNDNDERDFFILADLLPEIVTVEDDEILDLLDICSDSHLEHIKKHINELNEKINQYKENIRAKNQQIFKLNEMMEEKNSLIANLEAGIRKTGEKYRIVAVENKSLTQKMEILQGSLEYKDNQIISGNSRINALQNVISNSKKETEELKNELEILKAELSRYESKSKIPLVGRFFK